jgi:prephenate dehydrogenase
LSAAPHTVAAVVVTRGAAARRGSAHEGVSGGPVIRTAAVVGTGLIGTSLGLALTRHGVRVHLSDTDERAVRTAAALGAGTVGRQDGPVDLAVLAVPPGQIGAALLRAQRDRLADAYTDVASVKAYPEQAVALAGADPSSYVGGHPIAGRERSGPLAAREDLFEGRSWVLTPSDRTSPVALNRALAMVALCGAVPVIMDSRRHDRAVAFTSHLPYVVSTLLAARLAHAPKEAHRLIGQGMRDMTRIARADVGLWNDTLRANSASLTPVLAGLADDLRALIAELEGPQQHAGAQPGVAADPLSGVAQGPPSDLAPGPLSGVAARATAGLELVRSRPAPGDRPRRTPVLVALSARPGELAELLDAVTDFGVDQDQDLAVRQTPGSDRLVAELRVPPLVAEPLLRTLAATGWADRLVPPPAQPSAQPPAQPSAQPPAKSPLPLTR